MWVPPSIPQSSTSLSQSSKIMTWFFKTRDTRAGRRDIDIIEEVMEPIEEYPAAQINMMGGKGVYQTMYLSAEQYNLFKKVGYSRR